MTFNIEHVKTHFTSEIFCKVMHNTYSTMCLCTMCAVGVKILMEALTMIFCFQFRSKLQYKY